MENAELDESYVGMKNALRNNNNFRYVGDTMLIAESEELKSLLMKMNEVIHKLREFFS